MDACSASRFVSIKAGATAGPALVGLNLLVLGGGDLFPHILWWAYFLVDVFIEQAGHTGSPAYVLYIAMDWHTITRWTYGGFTN